MKAPFFHEELAVKQQFLGLACEFAQSGEVVVKEKSKVAEK